MFSSKLFQMKLSTIPYSVIWIDYCQLKHITEDQNNTKSAMNDFVNFDIT